MAEIEQLAVAVTEMLAVVAAEPLAVATADPLAVATTEPLTVAAVDTDIEVDTLTDADAEADADCDALGVQSAAAAVKGLEVEKAEMPPPMTTPLGEASRRYVSALAVLSSSTVCPGAMEAMLEPEAPASCVSGSGPRGGVKGPE